MGYIKLENEFKIDDNTEINIFDSVKEPVEYEILGKNRLILAKIEFQKGTIKEAGVNGVTIEDLLLICKHRLEEFQKGEFKCTENCLAIEGIKDALKYLNYRTQDRQKRNVEGTYNK